jgi:hypothetical protein
MYAERLKAIVDTNGNLRLLQKITDLPAGREVEVILLSDEGPISSQRRFSLKDLSTFKGGKWLGGRLRREEIYGEDGR